MGSGFAGRRPGSPTGARRSAAMRCAGTDFISATAAFESHRAQALGDVLVRDEAVLVLDQQPLFFSLVRTSANEPLSFSPRSSMPIFPAA
jgi:hypothetical protein